MTYDWTIGVDDMLVERYHGCVLCGAPASWMDIRSVGLRGYFAALCRSCYAQHGWQAVDALLARRYQG